MYQGENHFRTLPVCVFGRRETGRGWEALEQGGHNEMSANEGGLHRPIPSFQHSVWNVVSTQEIVIK